MDAAQQEATARARELQRSWYGEPLGALFRRLIDDLGLNQARLAAVLGLSAPMLSQLMSGQRAKIGNPAVVQRVQALQELAGQVADGSVSAAEATDRMEEIRRPQGGSRPRPAPARPPSSSRAPTVHAGGTGDPVAAAFGRRRRRHHRCRGLPRPHPPRTGRVPPGVRRGAHRRRGRPLRVAPELTEARTASRGTGSGRSAMGEVFAGRYELVDPIGRGGVGAVWRAWDHRRRALRGGQGAAAERRAHAAALRPRAGAADRPPACARPGQLGRGRRQGAVHHGPGQRRLAGPSHRRLRPAAARASSAPCSTSCCPGWPRCTRRASCTATSSPPTSCWRPPAPGGRICGCPTSASPCARASRG